MSTRANVQIADGHGGSLWFYRHSDGYPESTLPTLQIFMEHVIHGRIRADASQAGGWLIVIGHQIYDTDPVPTGGLTGWKVGAYEPTENMHGDIEYVYTLNLDMPGEIIVKSIYEGRKYVVWYNASKNAWEAIK